jgi:hypothetical protein
MGIWVMVGVRGVDHGCGCGGRGAGERYVGGEEVVVGNQVGLLRCLLYL